MRPVGGRGLAAGALAVAVLALAGCAMSDGGDGSPKGVGRGGSGPSVGSSTGPKPAYTVPDGWVEPLRWAVLSRGERTDRYSSETGFPHTEQGAEAMLVVSGRTVVEGSTSVGDEQLRIFYSYITKDARTSDNAEKIELSALQSDKELHRKFGLRPGGDLPSGAYARNTAIGFKVIAKSADEVSLWLLSRVAEKAGETSKESVTYTRSLVGAEWEDGDWKLSPRVTSRAMQETQGQTKPQMVVPGDAKFNEAGWTAIREAS